MTKVDRTLKKGLKAVRQALGLTQEQVAAQMRIPCRTYRRYETGESNPTGLYRDAVDDWLKVVRKDLNRLAARGKL